MQNNFVETFAQIIQILTEEKPTCVHPSLCQPAIVTLLYWRSHFHPNLDFPTGLGFSRFEEFLMDRLP
jgi:hypothetical protein